MDMQLSECLDEATVLDLVQGRLDRRMMRAADAHLAQCSECRALVSELARSSLVDIASLGVTPTGNTLPLPPSERSLRQALSVVTSRHPSPVREGDLVAGKYRVESVLGQGGMGVVVAATHVHLGQRVALKFLLPSGCSSAAASRFLREGRAAVRIQSEHVARVTDVGILDGPGFPGSPEGVPYLVMEFLRGIDLSQLLATRGPLPVDDAIDFVLQACEAIAEAHALGIVHRDLKPANLFLTSRADGSPLVKVLDFGISKAPQGLGASSTGDLVMGSPRFMSPEQMRSTRDVDARTDVWALGVVLHELLTGRPVFEADTLAGLCALIATGAPTPLRSVRPDAPEVLAHAILHCLEKEPHRRMQSVGDLASALLPIAPARARVSIERIVGISRGAPPTEAPVRPRASASPSYPPIGVATGEGLRRTSEKGRFAAATGTAVLAVLLIGAGAFSVVSRRGPARGAMRTAPATSESEIPAATVVSGPARVRPPASATGSQTEPRARAPSSGASPSSSAPPRRSPQAPARTSGASPTPVAPAAAASPAAVTAAAPSSSVVPHDPEPSDVHRKGLLDRK